MKKRYKLAIHVAAWAFFVAWIFYIQFQRGLTFNKAVDSLVGLSFAMMIFYLNWYVLIPRFLARNQIFGYLGVVLLTLTVVALVRSPLDFYVFREFNPGMTVLYSSDRILNYVLAGLEGLALVPIAWPGIGASWPVVHVAASLRWPGKGLLAGR